jgi:2,4-dienoyl-CoA reductase-like NADH-dependent reductase (Old Yellow Enzyme family)
MNKLFNDATIGKVKVKNRIIRSATHEGLGNDDGSSKDELTGMYERLAKGYAGAIITGYCGIMKQGRTFSNMRMFDDDKYIEFYKNLNDKISSYGTPIINQIAHGGGNVDPSLDGVESVSPSPFKSKMLNTRSRELSEDEIEKIIKAFVKAIVRSKKAGFAAAQLHCAHGYLLSEFLSPHVNNRNDKWGGSSEKRFLIVREIIDSARNEVGDYPIWAKFSSHDGDKGGITLDLGIRIASHFQKAGLDALEVSCGGINDGFNTLRVPKIPLDAMMELVPTMKKMPKIAKYILKIMGPLTIKRPEPIFNYNVAAAEKIKNEVDLDIIAVGGIRKREDMEDIINSGKVDAISLSRPFIIEPNIVEKLKSGKQDESRCINCGYCLFGCLTQKVRCYYGKIKK